MIETERLNLRSFRESDLDDYARSCADPEVVRYVGTPFSRGHPACLHVAFSPNGKHCATGGKAGQVTLHELKRGWGLSRAVVP
jgi:hypothetical protein